jgi:hypothetical protein
MSFKLAMALIIAQPKSSFGNWAGGPGARGWSPLPIKGPPAEHYSETPGKLLIWQGQKLAHFSEGTLI